MKKYIFGLIGLIGFIDIIGTAGASDIGSIDMRTLTIRGGIGVLLIVISLIGIKIGERKYVKNRG